MLGVRQVDHNNEMAVSGPSFEELTLSEMRSIQGSGDIQAETTPVCGYTVGLGIGVVLSVCKC